MDEEYPFGEYVDEMDIQAFFNMRQFVEDALVAKGAVIQGAGIGGGEADIDFLIDGAPFKVIIKPRVM